MLRYRVLGPLEVERDGVPVALPAAKHRTLLLALLVRVGEVCPADRLVDALWDRPPASATKLLHTYVSQLRAALGPVAIETVAPGYRLAAAPDAVDARRFERLHDAARAALADGNPELAASLAARAAALWRGPALADVAYEAFAERDAARWEELRLQCTELGLDAALATGGHDAAIGDLTRLCRDHPLRERLHERLALALYRAGRQADALAAVAAARTRLRDELGLDPDRGLQELERAILAHDPALEAPAVRRSPPVRVVPSPPGPLVGRQRELGELRALLARDEARLVTVSGPGGSGKTRLALEVARRTGDLFANGVVVVEVAAVVDPAMVVPAVAQALGLTETADEPAGVVVARWLRDRQALLVVDNLEQVVDAAADLVALVAEAPLVTVLVTSRRVLHVTGEHVYPLGPLPLDDACRLFALRAEARDPAHPVDVDDDVRAICARLDCLPLAVELAAARASVLDAGTMRRRLQEGTRSLGAGPRDRPARQQTLADTIRWTTDLLDARERRALARFSVFAGGAGLAAAEAVCDADLDTIASLVDWNLLRREDIDGTPRLVVLETVREQAAGLLDELGERRSAEAAHAAVCLALAEALAAGSSQPDTLRATDHDLDDLRAAHERALAGGDHVLALRLATALYPYWYVRGLFREGRDRIAAPLVAAGEGGADGALQAHALRSLASMHYLLGDDDQADDAAALGVAVGTSAGALEHVMGCHTVRGLVAHRHGRLDAARGHVLASAAVAEGLGRALDVAIADTNLGDIALAAGELDEARHRFGAALDWHRAHGTDATFALIGLGTTARRQGLLDEADVLLSDARRRAERSNRPHNVLLAALGQAAVAADRGDEAAAGHLLGHVDAIAATLTGDLVGGERDERRRVESLVLAAVGPDRLAGLLEAGRSAAPAPDRAAG